MHRHILHMTPKNHFEMINLIVGDKWSDVIQFRDKERIQKIESLGLSVGYRWAEIQKIHSPAWNNLIEVMRDISSHFWLEVFGEECPAMHTDNSNIFVLSSKRIRPLSKIQPCGAEESRLQVYALLYKSMIDGILSLAGFRTTTTFRQNGNSGDYEFIVTAI